jgi:putative phosphoribosyl transferase
MRRYLDRTEAGRVLATELKRFAGRPDVIVLALPRGGVPVAYEVARGLGAPLDVMVVRKLGAPGQEELAMGAIASGSVLVLNEEVVRSFHIPNEVVAAEVTKEQEELARRELLYRGDRPYPSLRGKTVLLVDDGLATGSTMRAAVVAVSRQDPARIVVAVPTAPEESCREIAQEADECVCVDQPEWFFAVAQSYEDFPQTSDAEVRGLLDAAAARERDHVARR